ncbi:protein FAM83D [Osmerus eperlanus]|uniref:protein FAM83D n=1 Tax=Osmerus eperlanus TaxID=29151 RepID=UPI002E0F1411
MSNSHEQSLNENVVFLPMSESSPEFLHCERERYALETLLSLGPGAFNTRLGQESLAPFLSPEEVNQISGWAKNYHISQLQLENGEEEEDEEDEEEGSGLQGFSGRYFPTCSDTPAPSLVLGWPERMSWVGVDSATVYTNPPAEGQPNIREVIRRLLQGATKVIAIVTDRLSDNAVIGDLHCQASRGVPVYLILNQRSIQENFTSHRLAHPNIQVRVLGGKTYCTREGKMVVGEMKNNFLLVDLETVVQGSYSMTWSDAHLHRQLVTVLSGQVVESFDQEFRILFAASLPIPDSWKVAKHPMDVTFHSEKSDLGQSRHLPMEPLSTPEPSLPPNSPLDWEAMGVIQRHMPESRVNLHGPSMTPEEPLLFSPHERKTLLMKESNRQETTFLEEERTCLNPNFVKRNQQDNLLSLKNTRRSETDFQTFTEKEFQHRVQTDTSYSRLRSWQRSCESGEERLIQPRHDNTDESSRRETPVLSHQRWHQPNRRQDILEEESKTAQGQSESSSWTHSPSSTKKPLILRVPERESFSSLSDIMRRLQPRQSSSGLMTRVSKSTVSELSRSMMDLRSENTDTSLQRDPTAPTLQANYFDPFRVTPALALMKKRNDDLKAVMLRQPKTFLPPSRPRSSSFGLQMDWRRPQTDRERGREETK